MAKESGGLAPSVRPIIVIKKHKKHAEGHHGGMWKVAYADFVTAMMAFFLLMWLINTVTSEKLEGIANFFTPIEGIQGQSGNGMNGGDDPQSQKGTQHAKSSKDAPVVSAASINSLMLQKNMNSGALNNSSDQRVVSIMNNLQQSLAGTNEQSKFSDNIVIEATPEGIKIQIMDNINRSVFKPGSYKIQPYMEKFLAIVANLIKSMPNYISIEGHSAPIPDQDNLKVDLWDLSVNRANAIRLFFESRIKSDQIIKLMGRADTEPYDAKDPTDPKNDRIVIMLLNPESVSKYQKSVPDIINNTTDPVQK